MLLLIFADQQCFGLCFLYYTVINVFLAVMESPKSTKSGINNYHPVVTTPKASKKLYWPRHNEGSSPKMCGIADKQEEFGWGESPEPLKIDPKFITGHSKKRLDCVGSPISSHSLKIGKKPRPVVETNDLADNDLARIQEINRRIFTARPVVESPVMTLETPSMCVVNRSESSSSSMKRSLSPIKLDELAKNENVDILSFFHEDDDILLSQVDFAPDTRQTPNKTKFSKSLSDNQLDSPKASSEFRRCSSFQSSTNSSSGSQKRDDPQPLKKQKSFHTDIVQTQTKCSLEEIERKRLEAKYRREFKEIERRKLEAQKRLNERKARMTSSMVKRS